MKIQNMMISWMEKMDLLIFSEAAIDFQLNCQISVKTNLPLNSKLNLGSRECFLEDSGKLKPIKNSQILMESKKQT